MPASSPLQRSERIGIFGGTFDPPHIGHAAAARAVLDALALDRLLLVVANDPWQKSPTRFITPAEDRFAMTQALAAAIPGAEASRLEIDRGGPSYTVATVEALRDAAAASNMAPPRIYLVIGADLVSDLGTWERADDLARLVTVVVVSRPAVLGATSPPMAALPLGWEAERIDGPLVDVSSSTLRDALEEGRSSIEKWVPAEVMRCIRRRNLYAVDR